MVNHWSCRLHKLLVERLWFSHKKSNKSLKHWQEVDIINMYGIMFQEVHIFNLCTIKMQSFKILRNTHVTLLPSLLLNGPVVCEK